MKNITGTFRERMLLWLLAFSYLAEGLFGIATLSYYSPGWPLKAAMRLSMFRIKSEGGG